VTPPVDSSTWLRVYHPAPDSRARLVCFPHAGGSATYFFPVSAALAPEFEVLAVQYPGRQDRRSDPFIDTIDKLADRIHEALLPVIKPPFAFFGHSMGASLAFEVARRLEERDDLVPVMVFASGRRAPSRVREENVHLRDDAGIAEEMRRLGGTDARMLDEPELLEMFLSATRNDYRAIERYRRGTEARISAPIVVLTATDDPLTTVEEAHSWSEHTGGGAKTHLFDGGHFYLQQHAAAVIDIISADLHGELIKQAGV